jgi:predicted phosphoribosyltransferase
MRTRFANRTEAGQRLADLLAPHYSSRPYVLVLALPRGGVPVAFEVAKALGVPLEVFLVRKLGLPGHEELAMGAIATGGVRVLNPDVVDRLKITNDVIESVTEVEEAELERRERAYRGDRPPPEVRDRTVIIIDDGIATGSTMRAAVAALRQQNPARIVVATPTIAASTLEQLAQEADEVVAVMAPEDFNGVGQWYYNFTQTTDDEVKHLLAQPTVGEVPADVRRP